MSVRRLTHLVLVGVLVVALGVGPAAAHHPEPIDDGVSMQPLDDGLQAPQDPADALADLDSSTADVVSPGPSASVVKNIGLAGRGKRLLPNATTDVWAHNNFAYIGTFNSPCGTGEGYRADAGPVDYIQDVNAPGVVAFAVHNRNKPQYMGNLPSVLNSRVNDVKVASMNSGDILVHSNESCAGGDGGFEVYDMSDPRNPEHLAAVRVDEANETLRTLFGGVNRGVHNLFLFTQGERDYVAMQTHAWFGGFQIYELTDPTNPQFVSAWGAEFLCEEDYCSDDPYNETDPNVLIDHINGYMFCLLTPCFGSSQNRFLHDVTVNEEGDLAYLSHWDAGLILMDISDPANPQFISQALEPSAGDGEVNSHAAWPSEDGTTVVETEEDFDALGAEAPLDNWTVGEEPTNTIPAVGVSTSAGDDFEANQTGNTVRLDPAPQVEVLSGPLAPNVYPATEASGNQPKLADTGPIEGEAIWIGRACPGDPIENEAEFQAGDIAVARRGGCFFFEKLATAASLGASAIVVSNNVGNSQWGNVRVWDYSDPANPVLASEFDTVCSKDPTAAECDPRGTYSVHNVIVEKGFATFSWYSNGVIILDVRDPYNPVEVARYNPTGEEFEEQNAGIQDVWGIHKERGRPWLYASDRNGGLYILKPLGGGTGN